MSSLDARFGKRRTVNMSEEIANELNMMANLQGKTLFSLINDLGLQAIESHRHGFTLAQAVSAMKVTESAKKSRMVIVNQDAWYFASSCAAKTAREKWLKLLRASAQWEANVFLRSLESGSKDPKGFASSLEEFVGDFFWDCSDSRVELNADGDVLSVRLAFVPEMPLDHTQSLFGFFEALLNHSGYAAIQSIVRPGFITASFKRVNQKLPARA